MINLIDDLSTLTNVSDKTLLKFVPVSNYCISHAVYEAICSYEEVAVMDVGIGELHIKIDNDKLAYKFIPSKDLESMLIKTVSKNCSPIISKLELNLQKRIDAAYKELL